MKKAISLILALVLVFAMIPTAFAENDDKFTMTDGMYYEEDYVYPEARVIYGGNEIKFAYAQPYFDYYTMIPFRGFFEALGAKVTYTDGIAVATYTDGSTVTLSTVNDTLEYNKNGETKYVEYCFWDCGLDYSTLMLSSSDIANIFDLYDHYDVENGTCTFYTRDEVVAMADENLSVLSHILNISVTQSNGTMRTTSKLGFTGTLYGDKTDTTAKASADISSLADTSRSSSTVEFKVDLSQFKNIFGNEYIKELLGTEIPEWLQDGGKIDVIADTESGQLYYKSYFGENAGMWNTFGAADGVVFSGVAQLINSDKDVTIGGLLAQAGAPCETIMQTSDIYRALFGDDLFEITTKGATKVYTIKYDETTAEAFTQVAKSVNTYGSFAEAYEFSGTVSFSENSDTIIASKASVKIHVTTTVPYDISINITSTTASTRGSIDVTYAFIGKYSFTFSSTSVKSSETLPELPAVG